MGQVIPVDFARRHRSLSADPLAPAPTFAAPTPSGEASGLTSHRHPNGPSEEAPTTDANPFLLADTPDSQDSLTGLCARMRADTASLLDAVEELRRASDDLQRLPAMARELCAALD